MGMLSNLGTSAAGMFTDGAGAKAVIYIPNPNKYIPGETTDIDEKKLNDAAKSFEKALVKTAGKGTVDEIASSQLSVKQSAVKALKSLGPGNSASNKVAEEASENPDFFKIKVQFNPDSIRMDTLNGKVKSLNSSGNDAAKLLNEQDFTGRTKLSFNLIFDDVNLMDAFMLQEIVDMNVTKLADKALDVYTHGGNTFSVRARMEVFMALLASSTTQHVIFAWGKMVFRGQVTGVTNTYTMFNTSGNPIRGTMRLEITQDANKNDQFSYENLAWENSFRSTFKNGMGGGTSVASKILNNNILNI
ncbi:MAG: hypothetical protein ILN61_11285 [Lachnospiraceae bacterium]|nr:hypothetical protein [Lachnospiraceae bacterium]MBP5415802.1 hypothetical protein [Lachnospiraceae bacterium]